jgi:MFS family permease
MRTSLGEGFGDWGWRIPFLVSILLLAVSVWIRLSAERVAAFQKMKAEGKTSKAPLTESFGEWKNLKIVILALVGLTAGQAVVWYTGQFYALFFLTQRSRSTATANILIAASLLIGTPFFIVFGCAVRQDRPQAHHHGRLPAGRADLLPGVQGADHYANPATWQAAQAAAKVVVWPTPVSARSSSTRSAPSSSPVPATSPSRCWPALR